MNGEAGRLRFTYFEHCHRDNDDHPHQDQHQDHHRVFPFFTLETVAMLAFVTAGETVCRSVLRSGQGFLQTKDFMLMLTSILRMVVMMTTHRWRSIVHGVVVEIPDKGTWWQNGRTFDQQFARCPELRCGPPGYQQRQEEELDGDVVEDDVHSNDGDDEEKGWEGQPAHSLLLRHVDRHVFDRCRFGTLQTET